MYHEVYVYIVCEIMILNNNSPIALLHCAVLSDNLINNIYTKENSILRIYRRQNKKEQKIVRINGSKKIVWYNKICRVVAVEISDKSEKSADAFTFHISYIVYIYIYALHLLASRIDVTSFVKFARCGVANWFASEKRETSVTCKV